MLLLIFILASAGCYVEYKAIKTFPSLARLLARYRLASLGFSLVLSVMLGAAFGAAGLIVFAAGLCSTVMIQPVYAMMNSGAWSRLEQKMSAVRADITSHRSALRHRANQLWHVMVFTYKIVSLPFKVLFVVLDGVDHLVTRTSQSNKE